MFLSVRAGLPLADVGLDGKWRGGGVSRGGGGYWWVVLRLFIAVIKVYTTAIFHNPC